MDFYNKCFIGHLCLERSRALIMSSSSVPSALHRKPIISLLVCVCVHACVHVFTNRLSPRSILHAAQAVQPSPTTPLGVMEELSSVQILLFYNLSEKNQTVLLHLNSPLSFGLFIDLCLVCECKCTSWFREILLSPLQPQRVDYTVKASNRSTDRSKGAIQPSGLAFARFFFFFHHFLLKFVIFDMLLVNICDISFFVWKQQSLQLTKSCRNPF